MDWVLRFHATVLRGLKDGGMVIERREATEDRRGQQSKGPAIEMRFKGETFTISFTEGYRRIRLDSAELAKKRKESSWASEYETKPSGNFTFSIQGTEYQGSKSCKARKKNCSDWSTKSSALPSSWRRFNLNCAKSARTANPALSAPRNCARRNNGAVTRERSS